MIKKIVGFPLTWILYYIGHVVSYSLRIDWYHIYITYPLYNNLMTYSLSVQDWAGLEKPWIKLEE